MRKLSLAAAVGLGAILASGTAMAGKDLDAIRARGSLICGVGQGTAGFMMADSQGKWGGFDVDVCRAVAAAVFGDAKKVKYVPLSSQQRFTALQSGEVDILSRNTTMTLTRDTALGLDFTAVAYYDGQGFLVPKKLGVKSAKELNGATVCVAPGTTTERNLADYFRANNMSFKPVVIENVDEVAPPSSPAAATSTPTTPRASRDARRQPADAAQARGLHRPARDHLQGAAGAGRAPRRRPVRRHRALVALRHDRGRGVRHHSKNVDEMLKSENPTSSACWASRPAWARRSASTRSGPTTRQAGRNYGESFERNVGRGSPLRIERGLNELWTQGGLQYAPPIR